MDGNGSAGKTIKTKLSILPEQHITDEEFNLYLASNENSPKLRPDQISIYGITLNQLDNNRLQAKALVRSTVKKSIQFKQPIIALLDENQKPIAKKVFDLSLLGSIQPNTARPWTFTFPPNSILNHVRFNKNNWSLAFEKKPKHQLDLEDEKENIISESIIKAFEDVIAKAPPLKSDEVNVMGLSVKVKNNAELHVVILFRNGSNKDITFNQIPLEVKDARNDVIAKGTFKLEGLTVKANTSKPATFTFPSSAIIKDNLDLSSWKINYVE